MRTLRPLLMVLLLLTLSACGEKPQELPHGILGRWVTDADGYADRYFILSESAVVFATGEGNFTVHLITRVETYMQNANSCYLIHYKNDEGQNQALSLCYNDSREEIRFQNQARIAWKKYISS